MRILYFSLSVVVGLSLSTQLQAADELEQRAQIIAYTQQLFLGEEFQKLEAISRDYRTTKSRTSSGLWKLSLFYAGIGSSIAARTKGVEREAAFNEFERRTMKWANQYPDSPTAHIAHSMVLIKHAWAYRGGGYANTVKPDAWAPFFRYIALARENLEKYKSVAADDPRWYETMLTVARSEGWNREQFDNLLNEALTREPLFYQTYFLALEYLLPKWHGDAREIEAFAQDAVRRTSAYEGRGIYARIYWFASQTEFDNDLFTSSLAVWPLMKDGFDDVVASYPDAWNLNNYAKFACLARDKPKTRELLRRIESTIVHEAWRPASLLKECRDWSSRE